MFTQEGVLSQVRGATNQRKQNQANQPNSSLNFHPCPSSPLPPYGPSNASGSKKPPPRRALGKGRQLPYLPTSTVLARAPPLALRLPLEEEEPKESLEELLMLSLSWPLPQEVAAHPPRRGLRLRVGELSEVVSGALLSMLAIPETEDASAGTAQNHGHPLGDLHSRVF